MKQRILTFRSFGDTVIEESELIVPSGWSVLHSEYSLISPGTELFCIKEAISSGTSVQPGYILTGTDDTGQRCFLFPSLAESSACHCNVKAVGPDSLLIPLPDEISSEYAGFLRFINIGMHVFNQLDKLPESVCVIGLGPVGNLAAQTAKILGCDVTGVDLNDKRREVARECGITNVRQPDELNGYDGKFDLVIDTVAASSTLCSAVKLLHDGGECSIIGIVKDGDMKTSGIFSEIWSRKLLFRSGWEMLNPLKKQSGSSKTSTEENLNRAINWLKAGSYQLNPLYNGSIASDALLVKEAYNKLKDRPDLNMCYNINWQ